MIISELNLKNKIYLRTIKNCVHLYKIIKNNIMKSILTELVSTGNYDEKAISKFHAKQVKLNGGNIGIADAMVRIYKHNFLIRAKK